MVSEAKKYGIEIEGVSADGDTRLLKAMKVETSMPYVERSPENKLKKGVNWFQAHNFGVTFY